MSLNLSLWQLIGASVTILVGTLLHFLYDWTGKNVFAAPFSAVNESTWEHMKLLFVPLFVFALIQSRYFASFPNFWCVKLIGTLVGVGLIPTIFYTYSGVLGRTYDWANIGLFFVAAATAFYLEFLLFKSQSLMCHYPWLSFAAMCLLAVVFVFLTFSPPHIPLFKDPVGGSYGVPVK